MSGGRRPISGRKPGDKRVRVERHHSPYFRYTGPGQLTAKAAASAPTTSMGRFNARLKHALLGRPLANEEEIGERLAKVAKRNGMLLMGCDQCCYERGIAEKLVEGATIGCFPNLYAALAGNMPDQVITL